jgi:ankyrin repeat protein
LRDEDVLAMVDAIAAGDSDRVGELLDHAPGLANAKGTDTDQTPMLYLAMDSGSSELVKLLLDHGADWRITTRSGWTVLSRACSHGTPHIVDLLLQHGADLNTRDSWGSLPIYGAVMTRNSAMLEHLIARGAQPDLKLAIDLNQLGAARQLLEQDSSRARMRFGTGLTLLHDSAQVGDSRLAAMQLLLEFGARVNATTNWGATPLHLAAIHGNLRTIRLLLENGADTNAADERGRTPLMLAQGKGHSKCAALLGGYASDSVQGEIGVTMTGVTDETDLIDDVFTEFGGSRDEEPHPLDDLDLNFGKWFDNGD